VGCLKQKKDIITYIDESLRLVIIMFVLICYILSFINKIDIAKSWKKVLLL